MRLALLRGSLVAVAFAAALAVSAQSLRPASPESVGMSAERLERLSDALEGYVADGRLAGSVTLVARRGRVAYFEAFGSRDRELNAPMQRDAIFRIASQSKAIVSVAAMTFVEEGKLLLTDPVGKYLPEFMETKVAVSQEGGTGYDVVKTRRPITVRDLLTHTSGFGYGAGVGGDLWTAAGQTGYYFADKDETIRDSARRIASLPAHAQPGTSWIYGYSTDILGALVEVVANKPLDQALRERIFEPLGMRDTEFYLSPGKVNRLAAVYSQNAGKLERAPAPGNAVGQGHYVEGPRKSFSGGAGLLSTATDYARFLEMLRNGGTLDGRRILSRTTVELMTTSHLDDIAFNAGQGFGLGFYVVEDVGARGWPGSVGEFGWGGAYHTTYWVDPREELVVVHLTQLVPAGDVDDQAKVRALVYQAIVD
ncbi:MAG TPA: serine hydrolase domain-containing protein [Gammaproteobacteria bacterium]|nr:serine hydrolase domain-containing protein [Gammaproteobacteria bacterium]